MNQINLFQIASFILAASACIKVFFGIFFHRQLYGWAKKHYSQKKRPAAVNVLLVYALAMLVLIWTAVLTNYVPMGWILAAVITLLSLKSVNLLFNWESTAGKFAAFIDRYHNKLWIVDIVVALLGLFFLALGIWVY